MKKNSNSINDSDISVTAKGIAAVSAIRSDIHVRKDEEKCCIDGFDEFWELFVKGLENHPSAAEELANQILDEKRQRRREKREDKIMRVVFALLGAGLLLLGQFSASLLP